MLFIRFFKFMPLLVILFATLSQAIFFRLARNGILDLFNAIRDKKDSKKPVPRIHHYHLHYFPVILHSPLNTIYTSTKHSFDKIHVNQWDSLGWNNNELSYTPETSIYRTPVTSSWFTFTSYPRHSWNAWDKDIVDRKGDSVASESETLIRIPRNQQNTLDESAATDEKNSNPLMKFFEKLNYIKNSIFDPSQEASHDSIKHSLVK